MTRWIRFSLNAATPATTPDRSPLVRYGVIEGDTVYEAPGLFRPGKGAAHPLEGMRILPPCWPSKIVCVGRNYIEHARELGNPVPQEPLIFMKPVSSLVASGDDVVYPALSSLVSYEGELGAVVSRRARHVSAADAMNYVGGFTCVNDVTARDLQKKDGQWTRGKGFDTFCPVGPWIVPSEELDLSAARVRTLVNGELRQDAPVTDMIFSLGAIIEFVTAFMTLEPGDLLATGTPPGVGAMQRGDAVRVEITGIGALENKIV